MLDDYKPIIFNCPTEFEEIELFFAHDIHKGSAQHDSKKWESFKRTLLAEPNRYVIFVGDCFENAIVGSKSDIYTQNFNPYEQKEWCTQQFRELSERIIAVVSGNHCSRTTKTVGLYPLYDCCLASGIENRYRHHFAVVDIGTGNRGASGKQWRYAGYITHRIRDTKMYNGSDFVDGIDFCAYGHDHDPKDHSRSKLIYDSKNKTVTQKNIEVIDSGAFLTYGGYGVEGGYRPLSSKCYKLILPADRNKKIETVGFYV